MSPVRLTDLLRITIDKLAVRRLAVVYVRKTRFHERHDRLGIDPFALACICGSAKMSISCEGANMRRSGDRPSGDGQLYACLYFHTPPGMGWRLHISKVATEMRMALEGSVS
jgi:hypothetical protein